jgi:predicted transcriptional regulator
MKRAKTDIIFDMLRAMEAKGGKIKPTHLLYKSNLSHQRMKLYLDELKQKEMIKDAEDSGKLVYEITDKGRWFLQNFKQMKAFTEAFGL